MERQNTRSVSPLLTRRRTEDNKIHQARLELLFKNIKNDVDILPKHGRGKSKTSVSRDVSPKVSINKRDSSPKIANVKRDKSNDSVNRRDSSPKRSSIKRDKSNDSVSKRDSSPKVSSVKRDKSNDSISKRDSSPKVSSSKKEKSSDSANDFSKPVPHMLKRIKHERTKSLPITLESRNKLKKDTDVDSKRSHSAGRKSLVETNIRFITPEKCSTDHVAEPAPSVNLSQNDTGPTENASLKKGKKSSKTQTRNPANSGQSGSLQPGTKIKTVIEQEHCVKGMGLADIVKKKRMGRGKKSGQVIDGVSEQSTKNVEEKLPLALNTAAPKPDIKSTLNASVNLPKEKKKIHKGSETEPRKHEHDESKEVIPDTVKNEDLSQIKTTIIKSESQTVKSPSVTGSDRNLISEVKNDEESGTREEVSSDHLNTKAMSMSQKLSKSKVNKKVKDVANKGGSPKLKQARKILKKSVGSNGSRRPSSNKSLLQMDIATNTVSLANNLENSNALPESKQVTEQKSVKAVFEKVNPDCIVPDTEQSENLAFGNDSSLQDSETQKKKRTARKSLKSNNQIPETKCTLEETQSKAKSVIKKKQKVSVPDSVQVTSDEQLQETDTSRPAPLEKTLEKETIAQRSHLKDTLRQKIMSKIGSSELLIDEKQKLVRKKIGKYQRQMIASINKGSSFQQLSTDKCNRMNSAPQIPVIHDTTALEQHKKTTDKKSKAQDQSDIREFLTTKTSKSQKRTLSLSAFTDGSKNKKARLEPSENVHVDTKHDNSFHNISMLDEYMFTGEVKESVTKTDVSVSKPAPEPEASLDDAKNCSTKSVKKKPCTTQSVASASFEESFISSDACAEDYDQQYLFPSDESEISFNSSSMASLPNLVIRCSGNEQSPNTHNRSVSVTNESIPVPKVESDVETSLLDDELPEAKTLSKKSQSSSLRSDELSAIKKRKQGVKRVSAKSQTKLAKSHTVPKANKQLSKDCSGDPQQSKKSNVKKKTKKPSLVSQINIRDVSPANVRNGDDSIGTEETAFVEQCFNDGESNDNTIFGFDEELHGEPVSAPPLIDSSYKDNVSITSGTTDSSISSGKRNVRRRRKKGPWMRSMFRVKGMRPGQTKHTLHRVSHSQSLQSNKPNIVKGSIIEENVNDSCSVSSSSTISCISEVSSSKEMKNVFPDEKQFENYRNLHSDTKLNQIDSERTEPSKVLSGTLPYLKRIKDNTDNESTASLDSGTNNSTGSNRSDGISKTRKKKRTGPWMKGMTIRKKHLPVIRRAPGQHKRNKNVIVYTEGIMSDFIEGEKVSEQTRTCQPFGNLGSVPHSKRCGKSLDTSSKKKRNLKHITKKEVITTDKMGSFNQTYDKPAGTRLPAHSIGVSSCEAGDHETVDSQNFGKNDRLNDTSSSTDTASSVGVLEDFDDDSMDTEIVKSTPTSDNTNMFANSTEKLACPNMSMKIQTADKHLVRSTSKDNVSKEFLKYKKSLVSQNATTGPSITIKLNDEILFSTKCVQKHFEDVHMSDEEFITSGAEIQKPIPIRYMGTDCFPSHYFNTFGKPLRKATATRSFTRGRKKTKWTRKPRKTITFLNPGLAFFPLETVDGSDYAFTDNTSSPENHYGLSALHNRVHLGQNGSQATTCTNNVTSEPVVPRKPILYKSPVFPKKKRKPRKKNGTARKSFKSLEPMDFLFPSEIDDPDISSDKRSRVFVRKSFRSEKHRPGAASQRFHLRQKFSRSPLEIIAMKQRLEDERVDLAEKTRKKRGPRKSFPSPDLKKRKIDDLIEKCKPCSVVLTDFVKQLGIPCENTDTETSVQDQSFSQDSNDTSFDESNKSDAFTAIKQPAEHAVPEVDSSFGITSEESVADTTIENVTSEQTTDTSPVTSSQNTKDGSFENSFVNFITNKQTLASPSPKKRRKLLCPKPVRRIAPKVYPPSISTNDNLSPHQHIAGIDNQVSFSSKLLVTTESGSKSFTASTAVPGILPYLYGESTKIASANSDEEKQFICEIYKCKCCDFSTKTLQVICHHVHMHHSTALHCAYCNSVLKSYINARVHHEKCHLGREFHLVKFSEFDESQYYETQIDPVLPPARKFSCKYCSFASYDQEKMKQHVHTHVSVPLRCGYCGVISDCLTVAQKHHGEKHYQREFHLIKLAHLKETAHYIVQLESAFEAPERVESINTDEKKECEITSAESSTISSNDPVSVVSPTVVVSVVVSGNVEIQTKSSVSSDCLENRNLRNRYHCNYCSYSSNYMENIMLHGSEIHRIDTKYICSMCNAEFQRDRSKLSEHFLVSHAEQPVVYKKVPPFYDLEELNIIPGPNDSSTDKGNIFDKMQDIFGHSDVSDSDNYEGPHSQSPSKKLKCKLKTKTSAEADSTTTVLESDNTTVNKSDSEDMSSCSSSHEIQKDFVSSDTGEGSVSSNQLDDQITTDKSNQEIYVKSCEKPQVQEMPSSHLQNVPKTLDEGKSDESSLVDKAEQSDQVEECEENSAVMIETSSNKIENVTGSVDNDETGTNDKSTQEVSIAVLNTESDDDSEQDVSYKLYLDSDDDDDGSDFDVQDETNKQSVVLSSNSTDDFGKESKQNIVDVQEAEASSVKISKINENVQSPKSVSKECAEDSESESECVVIYDRLKYIQEKAKMANKSLSENKIEEGNQVSHLVEDARKDISLTDSGEDQQFESTVSEKPQEIVNKNLNVSIIDQTETEVEKQNLREIGTLPVKEVPMDISSGESEATNMGESMVTTQTKSFNSVSNDISSGKMQVDRNENDNFEPGKLMTVKEVDNSKSADEDVTLSASTVEAGEMVSTNQSTIGQASSNDMVEDSAEGSNRMDIGEPTVTADDGLLEVNVSSSMPEEFLAGANVKAVIDLDDTHGTTDVTAEPIQNVEDDDSDGFSLKIVDVKSLQGDPDNDAQIFTETDENEKEETGPTEKEDNQLFDDTEGNVAVTYKCLKCNVHTPKLEGVVFHLEATHGIIESLKCPYCGLAKGSRELQIYSHIKQYHPAYPPKVTVDMSGRSMEIIDRITIPLEEESKKFKNTSLMEKDIYMCIKCHTHMPSLDFTFEHLEDKHNDVFVYVCPYCKRFKAKEENQVLKHIRTVHNRPESTANVSLAIEENLFVRVPHFSKSQFSQKKSVHSPSPSKSHEVKTTNIDSSGQKSVAHKPLPGSVPPEKPPTVMTNRQPPPISFQGQPPMAYQFTRLQGSVMKTLTGIGGGPRFSVATRMASVPPPLVRFSPPGIPTNYIGASPDQNVGQPKHGIPQPKLRDTSMLASPTSGDGDSSAISPNHVSSAINLVSSSPVKQSNIPSSAVSVQRKQSPVSSSEESEPKSVATMSFRMTDRLHRCTDRLHKMHAQNKKLEQSGSDSVPSRAVLKVPTPGLRRATTQSPSSGADSPALSDSQTTRSTTALDLSRTQKISDKTSDAEQDDDLPPDAFQIFNLKPTVQAEAVKSPTVFQSPPTYREAMTFQMQGQVPSQYRNQSPYGHFTHSSPGGGFMHAGMTDGRQPSPHAQIKGSQNPKPMPSVFRCPYCPAKIPLLQREVAEHTIKFHKGCKILYIPF